MQPFVCTSPRGPWSSAQRRVSVRCPAPERCHGRRGVVMGTIQGLVWVSHGVMLPLMNAKQQYRIRWLHGWDPEVQVLVRAGRRACNKPRHYARAPCCPRSPAVPRGNGYPSGAPLLGRPSGKDIQGLGMLCPSTLNLCMFRYVSMWV